MPYARLDVPSMDLTSLPTDFVAGLRVQPGDRYCQQLLLEVATLRVLCANFKADLFIR